MPDGRDGVRRLTARPTSRVVPAATGALAIVLARRAYLRWGATAEERVLPQFQHVQVGDEFRLHPQVPLAVALVEPGRALVVHGGVPMGEHRRRTSSRGRSCWSRAPRGRRG